MMRSIDAAPIAPSLRDARLHRQTALFHARRSARRAPRRCRGRGSLRPSRSRRRPQACDPRPPAREERQAEHPPSATRALPGDQRHPPGPRQAPHERARPSPSAWSRRATAPPGRLRDEASRHWVVAAGALLNPSASSGADPRSATIERRSSSWSTAPVPPLVTTGGTGPAPRDVTPEATLAVADRRCPLRGADAPAEPGVRPTAILSRQVAVIRKGALIVNLPGSRNRSARRSRGRRTPKGARACRASSRPSLLHRLIAVLPRDARGSSSRPSGRSPPSDPRSPDPSAGDPRMEPAVPHRTRTGADPRAP